MVLKSGWIWVGMVVKGSKHDNSLSLFYMHTLLLCLGVCLFYPIIVKTAEPIGPKFFVGPNVTSVLWMVEFSKFASNKIHFLKIFEFTKFFYFCFAISTKRSVSLVIYIWF